MSFNRLLLIVAVLFSTGTFAYTVTRAQDSEPSAEAVSAAIVAFKASGLGDTFDKVLPLVSEQVQNRLLQQRPDLRIQVPEVVNDVAVKLIPRRRELDTAVGRIWARVFTLEELKAITAFYRSEVGKKYLDQGPGAFETSNEEMRKWSQRISDEMYDQSISDLKAKGIDF